LAFAGLWLMFKRQRLVAWLILITWITFPDIYYLVQWSSRYREMRVNVSASKMRLDRLGA
jgi:hypothetical protein